MSLKLLAMLMCKIAQYGHTADSCSGCCPPGPWVLAKLLSTQLSPSLCCFMVLLYPRCRTLPLLNFDIFVSPFHSQTPSEEQPCSPVYQLLSFHLVPAVEWLTVQGTSSFRVLLKVLKKYHHLQCQPLKKMLLVHGCQLDFVPLPISSLQVIRRKASRGYNLSTVGPQLNFVLIWVFWRVNGEVFPVLLVRLICEISRSLFSSPRISIISHHLES